MEKQESEAGWNCGQRACGPDTRQSRRENKASMREHPGSCAMTPVHGYATRGLGNAPVFSLFVFLTMFLLLIGMKLGFWF